MFVVPVRVGGILQKLVVTRWDDFHHVDPWSSNDGIVRGLYVDHIKHSMIILYGYVQTGSAIMPGERVLFKPIQVRLGIIAQAIFRVSSNLSRSPPYRI